LGKILNPCSGTQDCLEKVTRKKFHCLKSESIRTMRSSKLIFIAFYIKNVNSPFLDIFQILGTLKYFVDGLQAGSTNYPGQQAFSSGLDRVQIGYFAGFANFQSIASVEFYLTPFSQADVAAAMARSKSFPFNSNCIATP
jgi:hypothetical protein